MLPPMFPLALSSGEQKDKVKFSFNSVNRSAYQKQNYLDLVFKNRNLVTNMKKVPKIYKDIWNEMRDFSYVMDDPYDPFTATTVPVKKFKSIGGGVCFDFCNYMHVKWPNEFHKVFCIGYRLPLSKLDKAILGCEEYDYTFGGHMFIVYNNNVLIEFANPNMLGVTEFLTEKDCIQAVQKQLDRTFKFWTKTENRFISTYIPEDKVIRALALFESCFKEPNKIGDYK